MNVGIVGAGFMAQTHLAGWRALGENVPGFFDSDPSRAQSFSAETAIEGAASFEELMEECDIIDVCTPTHTHHHYVMAALTGKKATFCEKPLARTVEEAREMVAAARQFETPLGVGHVVRFFPEYARAAATARSGLLGKLAVSRFRRCGFAPKGDWYRDSARSGGVIVDLMIHDLDFARFVAGEVVKIYAAIDASGPGSHAHAILTHEGGSITHVEASWRLPPPKFATAFEISGSEALITYSSTDANPLTEHLVSATVQEGDVPVAASPVMEDPYAAELGAFRDALVNGNPPPVGGDEGLRALELALAAVESARTAQPIVLNRQEVLG